MNELERFFMKITTFLFLAFLSNFVLCESTIVKDIEINGEETIQEVIHLDGSRFALVMPKQLVIFDTANEKVIA